MFVLGSWVVAELELELSRHTDWCRRVKVVLTYYRVSDEDLIIYQTPSKIVLRHKRDFLFFLKSCVKGRKKRRNRNEEKLKKSQTALGGGVDKQCKLQDFRFWDFNHYDFSTACILR
jgi:hypothetical protein